VILMVVRLAMICVPDGFASECPQHGGNAQDKSLAQAWKVLGFSWRQELEMK
jgi:hypothetical protein